MSATTTQAPTNPSGYVELVRSNRNFRMLWFGQIISLLGDWFNLIASATLIATLTQSGAAIGGLFVVRMIAPFLISPIAGVVADRYNRKYILIATDIARALTVVGFLFVREAGQVWLLYTLTAVQLGISGFFFPTRNAILPDIVSDRELGAANALSSATWSVMLAFGAALGGIVSGIWGIYPAFTIDALTFLFSAVFIARIAYRPTSALSAADKTIKAGLKQYIDGLRYLGRYVDILTIALHKAAISLILTSGYQVIQVTMAEERFTIGQGGGIGLGLLFGLSGVGTGIGPILARRFTGDRDRALRVAIIVGYGIAAVGVLIAATGLSIPTMGASFSTVLLGTMLRGVGGGIGWVFSTQLLLQLVPNRVRGRVFATEFAIFTLMSAAGAGTVGRLLDTPLGMDGVLYRMAALALIPAALWTIWVVIGQRREALTKDAGSNV